ncbi:cyclin-domain-containing protein [Cristinia sonorae]|uniref:Cyclin-domain-containing protein n=1 Tax=Cristinia sonorae TaxID=1940300 RepID=A0A8K0US34_9AGAR|nr:cyclin-domain-containing protein [Cristinia sonorae]
MNTTLPPLPIELLSTWSTWRPAPKSEAPLTPPVSAHQQRRVPNPHQQSHPTLPSIAHFDRHLSRHSPLTSPHLDESAQWHTNGMAELKLPPVYSYTSSCEHSPMETNEEEDSYSRRRSPSPTPQVTLDWLTPSTHRSSHFLAEKMCEMVCYLWFSALSKATCSPSKKSRLVQSTYFPKPNSATASLQFAVSPSFTRFMQKVLETTQVSQSVIVLSLHYIYRLKMRNGFTNGQAGSEYRVAIGALVLANKFVDDNTYTNKTWSEVSGIELAELNRMEREFLLGIDFDLYVDKPTYESWLNLLKGLVMAKEKDSRQWRQSRSNARLPPRSRLVSVHPTRLSATHRPVAHRARSTSPSRTAVSYSFSTPPVQPTPIYPPYRSQESSYPTPPRSGAKRTAEDAFSPTSASFPPIKPPKRPMGLSLEIPELSHTAPSTASSISPSEPLQSFSKLSLASGASPVVVRNAPENHHSPAWQGCVGQDQVPKTLVSAYRVDDRRPSVTPQNLYFYSLAGSPMEAVGDERNRKARLRYHQPPPPSSSLAPQPTMPMVIQSASASPLHSFAPSTALPNFSEKSFQPRYENSSSHHHHHHPTSGYHQEQHCAPNPSAGEGSIPAAPFANAGPPGVHFYSNNARSSPQYYWARDRRF